MVMMLLRSIQNIGAHSSRGRAVCFCANSANQKSFLGTYVLTRHSGTRRCIQSRARLSGVITDSESSLPLPTTENSGDWRMRRCGACSRHLERKTTRNMAHITWRVRLQRAQRCANDLSAMRWTAGTINVLSADTPNDWHLLDHFVERFYVE